MSTKYVCDACGKEKLESRTDDWWQLQKEAGNPSDWVDYDLCSDNCLRKFAVYSLGVREARDED